MDISNAACLVTGAASGLGAACAGALYAGGAQVVLFDQNADRCRQLAGELGTRAHACCGDVCSADDVSSAVRLAQELAGGLRAVVQCAGILSGQRIVPRSGLPDLEHFQRVIQVNLVGTFNVLRIAAAAMCGNPPLADGERGVVVCTASVAAWEGQIGQAAYSASKAGVAGMMLPAARELGAHGIRVLSIAPGMFATPMVAALPEPAQTALAALSQFPQRLGRPEEFAALALHAIENVMLNGTTIRLDGAMRMSAR